jgi:hypothetical protein
MDWLILIGLVFVTSCFIAAWMLARNAVQQAAPPKTIYDEYLAYKMANEKYRGRLSAKQRAALNQAHRDVARARGTAR